MSSPFRYFARPHTFAAYTAEPTPCDFCGETRHCYPGPFAGGSEDTDDLETICEECLVSGRLTAAQLSDNEGSLGELRRQLAKMRPDLAEAEIERIARQRTDEVESRTPSPLTWQDFHWSAHCGDYCRYLKEVGQPEVIALAPDGAGPAYLLAHADVVNDIEHAREVWEGVRPDAPQDCAQGYSVGVYLFQCLVCGEYILIWDCD
jgi:uncharacterized protein